MEQAHGISAGRSDLLSVVGSVRFRWRLKHVIRGLTITIGLSFVVYAALAYGVKAANYADGAVITARVVSALALVLFGGWFQPRYARTQR